MLNPIEASENIKNEFISYVSTSFHIADRDYSKAFQDQLSKRGMIAKGPYLDISDSFESGKCIDTLIREGEMSPLFFDLEKNTPEKDKEIKLTRRLYMHQEKAILKSNNGHNLVVTTGTGSGKTECFILPILNALLKEQEAGTLDNGVRAILIYPMNALANDQMKRLRKILKEYPMITFGVYNSSTKQEEADGIAEYERVFKDEQGHALKPLKNEVVSRKTMQSTPPHILVTNYAMLEYMMLRPNDDRVFSNAKLQFLVLDEAHIYRGATGIETSLLLRRLKARIQNAGKVQHILTSATLGGKEANKDIVAFAETLCDAQFEEDDIIRSKTIMPAFPETTSDYPAQLFSDLANPQASLNEILDRYQVGYNRQSEDSEILYDLCLSSSLYQAVRKCAIKPMTIAEIAANVNQYLPAEEQDIVNIINVASKGEKNKTALIKARYHMFVRALEGAYITLGARKDLFLHRTKYTQDNEYRCFEAAVCDDCGRIGIAGKTVHGFFEFANSRWDKDKEIYLLRDQSEKWDVSEDDDEDDTDTTIERHDFVICPKCGRIMHESMRNKKCCECGSKDFIRLREAQTFGTRNEHRCPCCNTGHMKTFYLGYDAATAVLGTELFEQLPESEVVLKSVQKSPASGKGLFASARIAKPSVETIRKKRQFLSFSDSRSEAAFFACYMTSFYQEFLRRRGIWHVIQKNKQSISENPWEITTLVQELTSYFDTNRTFAEPGDKGSENLTAVSNRQAWIAVLNEMVGARRSTSLVSLGILDFAYKGNTPDLMENVASYYHRKPEDISALFHLLVMDLVYNGALESKQATLTDDEREYIYYTASPKRFVKCKQSDSDRKKLNISGWIPRRRTSGVPYKNGRVARTMDVLGVSEDEAIEILTNFWDDVLIQGEYALTPDNGAEYYISTDQFVVKAGTEDLPIYVCEKCGKTTMTNCMGKCVSMRCGGKLNRVAHGELLKDNHFAKLYSSEKMHPLHMKEHTAQLGRSEQQKYQEMFINKEINALSCSTTFEMGVDVGDLETVYLRNMPPSPANYVQRAGRAGRSIHSAAYALTYAKLGSHDFTYFEKPERMISGKIGVPLFSITNEKVIRRHIFAVALSAFFAHANEVYNNNNADVFLNRDGYEELINYLSAKPADLLHILKRSIPVSLHQSMGITDWSWVEQLIGNEGVLHVAVSDFRNTVDWYVKEIAKMKRKGDIQSAAKYERQLKDYRRSSEDSKRDRNELIEFLVRNNVLPKYGFPVDTVELHQPASATQDSQLQMVRDLQLAIAEYAPDAQVVADGKLYTSRYIRKLPQTTGQDWEEVYIAECRNPSCKTWNYRRTEPSKEGELCISCQTLIEKPRWKTAIEPRKGFIADSKPTAVPLKKPERSFSSDDFYIGDPQRQVMSKRTFQINTGHKIQLETSSNDSLMVVCKDNFYVCERCGYAISSITGKEEKEFNVNAKRIEKEHYSPWGKKCSGDLLKRELCHAFKTDVVQIVFGSSRAKNNATMLSVMYALLEALSEELDIERTDIKGCLHKVRYENSMVYAVVLYDSVAGGAGHVRRMVTDDGAVFQRVVRKAIDITKSCTCNPSCYNCLRNYYNQSVHDILDRKEAYGFLEEFIGDVSVIPDDEFEDQQVIAPMKDIHENNLRFVESYHCDYNNWNEFSVMIPDDCQEAFDDFDYYRIPMPSDAYSKYRLADSDLEFEVFLVWKDQKLMVFENNKPVIEVPGWVSMRVSELNGQKFSEFFNGGR